MLLLLMFLMKVVPKTNFKELWLCFLPVSHLMFISLLHFKLIFCEWYEIGVQFHSFACEYSSLMGLPQWLSSKEFTCSAGDTGDTGSIPGLERSSGGGHGNPLQYSCLKNLMARGAWKATVHGVAKSRTLLSYWAYIHVSQHTSEFLFIHLILDIFCSSGELEFLCCTPWLPQRHSCLHHCSLKRKQKILFLTCWWWCSANLPLNFFLSLKIQRSFLLK